MSNTNTKTRRNTNTFQPNSSALNAFINDYEHTYEGQVVYVAQSNPADSHAYAFYKQNYARLKLAGLIVLGWNPLKRCAVRKEYDGENETERDVEGNGDLFSTESHEIMRIAATLLHIQKDEDPILTSVEQANRYGLDFVIGATLNSANIEPILPQLSTGEFQVARHRVEFLVRNKPGGRGSDTKHLNVTQPALTFVTTLWTERPRINLQFELKDSEYPLVQFRDREGIRVLNVQDELIIPRDYSGVMSVPLGFLLLDDLESYMIIENEVWELPEEYVLNPRLRSRIFIQRID